jgi:thioredoxin-related protein
MNTRFFWLKSDGKTVKELPNYEAYHKLQMRYNIFAVFVHPNGDFYTTKQYLPATQFRKILEAIKEELKKQ